MLTTRRLLPILILGSLTGCDGGIHVTAHVRNALGQPVPGADLRLVYESDQHRTSKTNERGCALLSDTTAPGHYNFRLLVTHPGYSDVSVEVSTLTRNFVAVTLREPGAHTPSSAVVSVLPPGETGPCAEASASPAQ